MTHGGLFDHAGGRSIALQTAECTDIPNYQIGEVTLHDTYQHAQLDAQYGAGAEERCGASTIYNCHGLAFASRRTAVHESWAIYRILQDDKYQEVTALEALPGDLILYFAESGDIEHSGVLVTAPRDSPLGIPLVCSKWGKYKELLHKASDCPYDSMYTKFYRVRA